MKTTKEAKRVRTIKRFSVNFCAQKVTKRSISYTDFRSGGIIKLAEIFNTSVDFLINEDTEEKAKATLKDTRLLQLFKAVENLNDSDKNIITEVISTFVFQRETQKRLAI